MKQDCNLLSWQRIWERLLFLGTTKQALLGVNILNRQKDKIDAICTAEYGENMFVPFLLALESGAHLDSIPEILFRNADGIVVCSSAKPPKLTGKYKMDVFEIPDRNLLPKRVWDIYLQNYIRTYGFMHPDGCITGVSTINKGRGCTRNKSRCVYCGIMDLTVKLSSPDIFWKEIETARQQINANVFY
jgi:hypothetical protein